MSLIDECVCDEWFRVVYMSDISAQGFRFVYAGSEKMGLHLCKNDLDECRWAQIYAQTMQI